MPIEEIADIDPDQEEEFLQARRVRRELAVMKAWASQQGRNWRIAAYAELLVILAALCWVGYLGRLPKSVPYVLEHEGANLRYVNPSTPEQEMGPAAWSSVKRAALWRFIEKWRTVTSDRTAAQRNWDQAHAYIGENSPAAHVLSDWVSANDPIVRANKGELVTVEYRTYDVEGDNTMGLWWEETTSHADSPQVTRQIYRARLTYTKGIPLSDQARAENGAGILITELSLERVEQ